MYIYTCFTRFISKIFFFLPMQVVFLNYFSKVVEGRLKRKGIQTYT